MSQQTQSLHSAISVFTLAACFCAGDLTRPGDDGLDLEPFKKLAREAPCTDIRNRLFVIDGQLVFWDREGDCADNRFEQTLYGKDPRDVKCAYRDSIAGPISACNDATFQPLFQTILGNLDKADLGLGSDHTVRSIPL